MEQAPNYIALAIPFFLLLIIVEVLASARQKKTIYRLNDAITDLGCGIVSQLWAVFAAASLLFIYIYLYQNHRFYTFSPSTVAGVSVYSWWLWLLSFLLVDFFYYWWHRLSHEINFLWAAHIVHHQSEDYNLAVALRQAITTSITSFPFYLPLAFLGVPPVVYIVTVQFNTIYQFWIHTQLIKSLGPLESFLNTPAHHRVHHGINPRYLDKNYGAILIIWDKLFGTFEPETEAPVYGVVKPLQSFNPLWVQFHYWFDMVHLAQRATHWSDKLQLLFRKPEWQPRNLPPIHAPEVSPETFVKYDPPFTTRRAWYIGLHFVVILGAAAAFIFFGGGLPLVWQLLAAGLITLSLLAWGAMFENKPWGVPLEIARLALSAVTVTVFLL